MTSSFHIHSPIDNRLLFTRKYASQTEIDGILDRAKESQQSWSETSLTERIQHVQRFVDTVISDSARLSRELTEQMGRPIRYSAGEIKGFAQRAQSMLQMAPQSLADIVPPKQEQFTRFIRRVPLGTVLVLSPWNYPYLTAVNAIVPALVAGNTVVLKHAEQTAMCAERLYELAQKAKLPEGVFQIFHCTHAQVAQLAQDRRIDFIAFTGSVEGGQAVHAATAGRFVGMGLELGGKDPAYVRADANLSHAVENLVDGAFFNSGQSCCGIERIYVHESLYSPFVSAFVEQVKGYILGNPLDESTTLGPMVRTRNANRVREQIEEAISMGAKALIDASAFPNSQEDSPYLAPQVLIDVNHDMAVMRDESFGPVVGIMSVKSDIEAIEKMNDSEFGLTASIWTHDEEATLYIGSKLETGTVFMNRCDYLDPELAWVGVKNSGRGCTLSTVGFENLTRPKSFHLRSIK